MEETDALLSFSVVNVNQFSLMKKTNLSVSKSWLPLVAALILGSCTSYDGEWEKDDPTPDNSFSFSNYKLGEGMVRSNVTSPNLPNVPGGESSTYDFENGIPGIKITRTTYHQSGTAYNEFMIFNPASTSIYPGHVFVGGSVTSGEYTPVKGQKIVPITISNTLVPLAAGTLQSRPLVDVSWSSYQDILKDWLSYGAQDAGAMTEYEYHQVTLDKSGSVHLSGSIGSTAKLTWDLSNSWQRNKTHVLLKFIQKVYSVSMDMPEGCILANAPEVAKNFKGTVPVYVSDVYYGRIAYMLVSSNYSYNEVTAALGLLLPDWANLNVSLQTQYKKVLDESALHLLCIGGKTEQHGRLADGGWEGFRKSLAEPMPISTACPISYTLRYVDDNSVAQVLTTDRFPIISSVFVPECNQISFRITPTALEAAAGAKPDLCVWGNATMKLPNGQKVTLFNTPFSDYYKMNGPNIYTQIDAPSTTITLDRNGMDMETFLNQQVEITVSLGNTVVAGTAKGDDLGTETVTKSLKDLIFAAKDYQFGVQTRRKIATDFHGSIVFDISYFTK